MPAAGGGRQAHKQRLRAPTAVANRSVGGVTASGCFWPPDRTVSSKGGGLSGHYDGSGIGQHVPVKMPVPRERLRADFRLRAEPSANIGGGHSRSSWPTSKTATRVR